MTGCTKAMYAAGLLFCSKGQHVLNRSEAKPRSDGVLTCPTHGFPLRTKISGQARSKNRKRHKP